MSNSKDLMEALRLQGWEDAADHIKHLESLLSLAIAELNECKMDLFEAEDKFHVLSFYINDKQAFACAESRVEWMQKARYRIDATLVEFVEELDIPE